MYIPYDRFLMKNMFGLSDFVWEELFLILIVYVCFLFGMSRLNKRYIFKLSIAFGIISGFLDFIFFGSGADMPLGPLFVDLFILPLFCRISAGLGNKFREYWSSIKYQEKISISQICAILLSLLFLSSGILFTYLTYTWHQRFENTRGKVLSQTSINLSRDGNYIIPFEHIWPYSHGYVFIIKTNHKFLSNEVAKSAINDLRICASLKNGKDTSLCEVLLKYNDIEIYKDSTGEYNYRIYFPQLIFLEMVSYKLDLFIQHPASGLKGDKEINLEYTIHDSEMTHGKVLSYICYTIFLCFVLLAYLIYRRNRLRLKEANTDDNTLGKS